MHRIDVVLPTYNGSRYVRELLDSLVSQRFDGLRVLTRDDGSTDATVAFVDSYRGALRLERIENPHAINLGAMRNFELLLCRSDADYVMPCDQDDIWLPNRICTMYQEIRGLEEVYGSLPLMAYSDLLVSDHEGNIIASSFTKYLSCNVSLLHDPYYVAYKNPAPGCAMIMNRTLRNASLPIGEKAIMHDWWFTLVASLGGHIRYLDMPTLKYRLHADNAIGVVADTPLPVSRAILTFHSRSKIRRVVRKHVLRLRQAKEAFGCAGRMFSPLRYALKLLVGRWGVPAIGRLWPSLSERTWRPS